MQSLLAIKTKLQKLNVIRNQVLCTPLGRSHRIISSFQVESNVIPLNKRRHYNLFISLKSNVIKNT